MNRRLVGFLLAGVCVPALAQTGGELAEKTVRIVRAGSVPVIDGVLDEEIWSLAQPIDDFHQIDPNEYDEASEPTQVFLLFDDTHLYIGARLLDSRPDAITAQILRQGSDVEDDDYFGVILDPFLDRRNGYLFQLNPNGVRAEALYRNTTQRNFDWVGIWRAQATIREEGWTVEMAIPFKTLSFDPGSDSWGINFRRGIARNNESIGWISRTRQQNPSIAGTVAGFAGLEQGLGLDIVTSLSARESRYFIPSGSDSATEPSVDVFYKFTPAMTGVLTLNTDFSAAEVDDRQVNLTRFSLLFPEKRDFFSPGRRHIRVRTPLRTGFRRWWRGQPERPAVFLPYHRTEPVQTTCGYRGRGEVDRADRPLESWCHRYQPGWL